MERSPGVHDPHRDRWLSHPAHRDGLCESTEVLVVQGRRAGVQVLVGRTAAAFGLLDPGDHRLDPLGFLPSGQRRGDEHDDAVALAVGRNRAAASLGAAYLHLGLRGHGLTVAPTAHRRERSLQRRGFAQASRRSRRPGVDDAVGLDPGRGGAFAAVLQEVELARRVRVAVDGEQASGVAGELEQLGRRVASFGPRVDLDRDVVLDAGLEDRLRVEARGRPGAAVAHHHPAGAVAEHVHPRVPDRADHPLGHRRGVHAQLAVHAGHPHVEPGQHLVGLVEGAVVEDVDLDPLEQREPLPAQVVVDRVDDAELAGQPLDAEAVGDGQARRVVGEHLVLVTELDGGERHLLDRRTTVGPVRVRVQVAPQLGPQLLAALHERPERRLELGQPLRQHAVHRVGDHGRGARSDARQVRERAGVRTGGDLVGRQRQHHRRGVAEGLDPAGLLAASLHQERDPAQRRDRSPGVRIVLRARHLLELSSLHTRWTNDADIVAGQRPVRRPRVARCPQPRPPRGYLSTAPAPVQPGCPQRCPQAVHRRHAGRVDPLTSRHLAWTADGAPSHRHDVRKGKASVADLTGSPFFHPPTFPRMFA